MKTNFKMETKVWTMSKELEEKFLRGLMEFGLLAVSMYIIYYLFAPTFDIGLILDIWNQPTGFFRRLMDVTFCFYKQVFDIISGFSAGQVLLLLIPGLARKGM